MVTSVQSAGSNQTRTDGNVETPRAETFGSFSGRVEVGGSFGSGVQLSQLWQGDLAEVVITSSAISTADAQRLEGYYAHTWGLTGSLPAEHPYRTTAPLAVPSNPSAAAVTGGDGQLQVSWTAPIDDGGAAVTDYVVQYRSSPSGTWQTFADGTSAATTATVTGLVNGTPYDVRVAALNARGTGAWSGTASGTPLAASWTPANLGNLSLWLDAADGSTLTLNGSTVSQWRDRSGNNRNWSQPNAGTQPGYAGASLNGRPTLTFNGSQWFDGTITYLAGDMFAVTSANGPLSYMGLHTSNASELILTVGGTELFNTTGTEYVNGTETRSITFGQPFIWGVTGINRNQPRTLGQEHNAMGTTRAWRGSAAELVVTSSALSTLDRQKLEGYLAHKWGLQASLPADHPFKAAPPSA
jgi:hypothetical protein